MNRHRILKIIPIAAVFAVLTFCGTVLAYMLRQTGYVNNSFIPAEVSCNVDETFDGKEKSVIKVENTGSIDAYIRVRLVSYWVDSNGEIAAKPSSMPEILPASGWIEGTGSTYYYQSPVPPDGLTDNLLSVPICLEKDENGLLQVVEVFAEAIQSNPEAAVKSSWKAETENGNIIKVP